MANEALIIMLLDTLGVCLEKKPAVCSVVIMFVVDNEIDIAESLELSH